MVYSLLASSRWSHAFNAFMGTFIANNPTLKNGHIAKPTMVFASKTQTPTFILGMVAIMKPIVILAFATRSNATVCETLGGSFATKGLRQLYLLKGLGKNQTSSTCCSFWACDWFWSILMFIIIQPFVHVWYMINSIYNLQSTNWP